MKKIKCLYIVGILLLCLTGCSETDITDQMTNAIQAEDEYVLSVKEGTNLAHPEITYGEAFENFFEYPTWKHFKGVKEGLDEDGDGKPDTEEENVDIVEFTGYCMYKDVKVKALIQFTLDDESDIFEATYLSFNEIPQDYLTLYSLLDKVFEENTQDGQANAESTQAQSDGMSDNEYSHLQEFIDCINSYSDPPLLEGEELEAYYKSQYDEWKTGQGYSNVHMNEDGTFYYDSMESVEITYYDAYAPIVGDVYGNYGEYAEYGLYDFDHDGILELIISAGTCDADWLNDVYTIENGYVNMIGEFYGSALFYESETGNGIYSVSGHMGHQVVELIEKQGSQLYESTIVDGEAPDDEYYSNPYPILTYPVTDDSLLLQY